MFRLVFRPDIRM